MRGNARGHTLDHPATKQLHSSNFIPPAKRFLQFSLPLFSSIFFLLFLRINFPFLAVSLCPIYFHWKLRNRLDYTEREDAGAIFRHEDNPKAGRTSVSICTYGISEPHRRNASIGRRGSESRFG